MLILTPDHRTETEGQPRLDYVMGELARTFRPGRRPHRADPDSKRNVFVAMCRKCPWQRDYGDPKIASEASGKHEQLAHGSTDVPQGGLVMVECR